MDTELRQYFLDFKREHGHNTSEFEVFMENVLQKFNENERRFTFLKESYLGSRDESALNLSNFKKAIDMAAMVINFNSVGIIKNANPSFCKKIGYKSDYIIGKSILDFIADKESDVLAHIQNQIISGESWQGELQILGNHKKNIWIHCTIVPLRNIKGKVRNYMAILDDVTINKIYEEELIHSESKYKEVVNSVKEVIFQIDTNGEWTFLNNAWTDITGYHIHDSLGNSIYNSIHAEDLDQFKKEIQSIIHGSREFLNNAIRIRNILGQFRVCEISIRTTKQVNGRILGLSGTINDVTEKRRNEELLIKSYSFQNAILNSARQSIISTDIDGNITSFNTGAEQMLKYSGKELVGNENISAIIKFDSITLKNYDTFSALIDELISIQSDKNSCEIETCLIQKTNEKIDVLLSVTSIRDQNNLITGYLFIAIDISNKKKIENENEKLSKVLEETPDFVAFFDMGNNLIYTNKSWKKIRGDQDTKNKYQKGFPLYPSWVDLIIKKQALPIALEKGSWKGETAIYDKDGNIIPVYHQIIIHKDSNGNPVYRSVVLHDITERKVYEQKLLLSEKRNRDLINYSQGIICTHDLEGKIMMINPAGCKITGYDTTELVGTNLNTLIPAENRDRFLYEYLKSFENSTTSEGILKIKNKSGQIIQLLYKNYMVKEANGSSYVVGFAHDITDRINTENELKLAKVTAEESLKTKEVFLANMSHEIRTPMNGIVGLTNLLMKSDLNPKQLQYTKSVKNSAENLLVIINDILDFSKIQAGKLEIRKAPFDITDLVYNLRQTFLLEASKKGIKLVTHIDDQVETMLLGDVVRLNQILVNLLSNAIKFTNKGTVQLSISTILNNDQATRLKFSVQDTGIGINKDNIKYVFKSFTQANSNTTREYGGTGLGLSIVSNLLELMGSKIKVQSKVMKGSEFYFELNLEKAGDITIPRFTDTEVILTNKLSGIKILLAEDNKVNQLFANELLSDWGAKLDIADNGKIALELLKKNKYNLILMDIQMPELSGIDATIEIRNHFPEEIRKIPIIAMTANAMKGDDEKFIKIGMNDVVFKPFQSLELYNKIASALSIAQINDNSNIERVSKQTPEIEKTVFTNEYTFINLNILHSFSKGKIQFVYNMLKMIDETLEPAFSDLNEAIYKKNYPEINRIAHKLIPNLNMIGNQTLEDAAKWIENNALDHEKREELVTIFNNIKPLLMNVLQEISAAKCNYEKLVVTS